MLIFKKRRRKNSRRLNGHRQVSRIDFTGVGTLINRIERNVGQPSQLPSPCSPPLPVADACEGC